MASLNDWDKSDDAGPGGTKFGLVYRKDPMVLEYRTGRQFERVAPQRKGLGWEVFSRANSGGVVVKSCSTLSSTHDVAVPDVDPT